MNKRILITNEDIEHWDDELDFKIRYELEGNQKYNLYLI